MTSLIPLLLLVAQQCTAQAGPILTSVQGTMSLKCRSQWHQLDLSLTAQEKESRRDFVLPQFAPSRLKSGLTWEITAAQLAPLAKFLQQIPWKPRAADTASYARWQGSMKQRENQDTKGKLTLKLARTTEGFRGKITGEVVVQSSGWLGSRFGPNGWEKTWTHKLSGTVHLTARGDVRKVELTDQIEVTGGYTNKPGVISDRAAQKGSVSVSLLLPKPLTTQETKNVEKLVSQLGSKEFDIRQNADKALRQMGPRIIPLLHKLAKQHSDPEVRIRIRMILHAR